MANQATVAASQPPCVVRSCASDASKVSPRGHSSFLGGAVKNSEPISGTHSQWRARAPLADLEHLLLVTSAALVCLIAGVSCSRPSELDQIAPAGSVGGELVSLWIDEDLAATAAAMARRKLCIQTDTDNRSRIWHATVEETCPIEDAPAWPSGDFRFIVDVLYPGESIDMRREFIEVPFVEEKTL
jgi:hypothetical protein